MLSAAALFATVLGTESSAGCGSSPPYTGISQSRTISVNGDSRTYRLFVPSGYDGSTPVPAIYSFHGWYGSGSGQESDTGFSTLCETEGCIAIYPDGDDNNAQGAPGWNSTGSANGKFVDENGNTQYTCDTAMSDWSKAPCPYSCGGCDNVCIWGSCTDDRGFLEDILDEIESTLCVDLDRVYIDGMSNGAMFMWEVGKSNLNERFAAGVSAGGNPHIGFNLEPTISGTHFSVLDVHGKWDQTVPANASSNSEYASDGDWYYTPIDEVMEQYGQANGCSEISGIRTYSHGIDNGVWCREMYECPSGVDVVRCSFRGGHTWPSNYAQFAWMFMSSHSKVQASSKSGSLPAPQRGEPSPGDTSWIPYLDSDSALLKSTEEKFSKTEKILITSGAIAGGVGLLGASFCLIRYCVQRKNYVEMS